MSGTIWLLSLSVSTYLHLSNIKIERIHNINIIILILAMISTVLFALVQSVVRINNNNILSGIVIACFTGIFVIIFITLVYWCRNSTSTKENQYINTIEVTSDNKAPTTNPN